MIKTKDGNNKNKKHQFIKIYGCNSYEDFYPNEKDFNVLDSGGDN